MDHNDLLFWTYILADHALFQSNAFSHKEAAHIETAEQFYHAFITYNQAFSQKQSVDLHALEEETVRFIDFKKQIVAGLLRHQVLIGFSPTFINHMINEADEFLSILRFGTCPAKTENGALYIKTWLADAYGHARTLAAFLDLAETPSIKEAQAYKNTFGRLGKKASEMYMIHENLGAGIDLALLKEEVTDALNGFNQLCQATGRLLDAKKIMCVGTLSSEVTNHFVNEHMYFMHKMQVCM
ncbi:MAG: DUF2935 domain-containing protein [Defluviitaleaceae bacterium]|nr:DUF2935 domain-containing protein [Defluviitaleaceae bacterium]